MLLHLNSTTRPRYLIGLIALAMVSGCGQWTRQPQNGLIGPEGLISQMAADTSPHGDFPLQAISIADEQTDRLDQLNALNDISRMLERPHTDQPSRIQDLQRKLEALVKVEAFAIGAADLWGARAYVVTTDDGDWRMPVLSLDLMRSLNSEQASAWIAMLDTYASAVREDRIRYEIDRDKGVEPPALERERTVAALREVSGRGEGSLVGLFADKLSQSPQITAPEAARLIDEAQALSAVHLIPELRTLADTIEATPIPEGDGSIGLWAAPKGEELYQALFRYETGMDLTASDLADVAEAALGDIREQLIALPASEPVPDSEVRALSSVGDITQSTIEWSRTHLGDFLTSGKTVPMNVRSLERRTADALRPISYTPPAGQLPARIDLEPTRFLAWPEQMWPALITQQTLPGRHLLYSMSSDAFPFGSNPGFEDGWAAYSVVIADEQGAFDETPEARRGALQVLALGAALARVDIGIHLERWERNEAETYLTEATGLPQDLVADLVQECVRHPARSANAFAGQSFIESLRARADQELGPDFNLREFHSVVLSGGPRPLYRVESDVRAWIDRQLAPAPTD